MSFFDEDEPTRATRVARPRAPRGATPPRPRPAGGPPDPQQVRARQGVALLIGILVLIILVFGVKGCVDSAKERGLKDYNRDVTAIVESSDDQVARQLFDVLESGGNPNDMQVQVNQIRLVADEDVKRAEGLDVPGDMKPAHRNFLLVLNLRATGVAKIAEDLRDVGGNAAAADQAVQRIAGQMQAFLASDVVYSQRVQPLIKQALDAKEIGGQTIPNSQFLPENLGWLDPEQVAARLGAEGGGGSGSTRSGEPAPGLHGHGLTAVTVGGVALQPGEVVNRVPAGAGLTFDVKFANQGDNDETNVNVTVRIEGAGKPITLRKRVNQTLTKKDVEASLRLETAPPIGRPVTIQVAVAAVPGEEKTDNNRQSYTVLFTR